MSRNKKEPLSTEDEIKKIKASLLAYSKEKKLDKSKDNVEDNNSLEERVNRIIGITNQNKKNKGRMIFFVMYDIESNKVRTLVHKYLERMGCLPIQRSIFLANAPIETYNKIKQDLTEVQESYDNDDSIMVLPVSTDYLRMMKVIGHHIEIDVITHSKNTIFF